MALTFYPSIDDALNRGTIVERMELLLDGAERYKAVVLEDNRAAATVTETSRSVVPRDLVAAYNWEEIARILREIREMPEGNKIDKLKKK